MALLIAAEDGLEVQHRADQCGGCLHTARAVQEHQVADREEFAEVLDLLLQHGSGLCGTAALVPQFGCAAGQQAGAEARTHGVHGADGPLREFVAQLRGCDARSLIGAADPGRQADIHNIQPLLQRGAEMIEEDLRVEQGGCDALALPQQFIVGVGIKGLDVAAIDDLLSVHRIAAGEHPDPKVLQQAARQIGAAVRKYRKRHKSPSVSALLTAGPFLLYSITDFTKKSNHRGGKFTNRFRNSGLDKQTYLCYTPNRYKSIDINISNKAEGSGLL